MRSRQRRGVRARDWNPIQLRRNHIDHHTHRDPLQNTPSAVAVLTANVRWLAGYRHPRHLLPDVAERLRRIFAGPLPLMVGAEEAGDPIAVLPVLFHLLWRQELVADLSRPLHQAVTVSPGAVD